MECGPNRAAINENAKLFKRKENQRKGIEVQRPTLQDIMMKQEAAIYTVPPRRG